jgi:hypothetical protein
MYKLVRNDIVTGKPSNTVLRLDDETFIPFSPDNTDYARFKKAVTEGAELQDADGVKMTTKAAKAFIATLP